MTGEGAFDHFAMRVAENGSTITPTKGKVPVLRKWQHPKATDAQWLAKILASKKYSSNNLGIVCGRVVGIDLDADEPAKAAQFEAMAAEYLGPTPFKRIGRCNR